MTYANPGEQVQIEYKVFLTDEAGTTTPMSHYMEDAHAYARIPEISEMIIAETGIEDIETTLREGKKVATERKEGWKNTDEFRQLLKVSGAARKIGFERGEMTLDLYDDVRATIEELADAGVEIRVYSSGASSTMKAGWKTQGLDAMISAYHSQSDVLDGVELKKTEAESYRQIAKNAGVDVSDMYFETDLDSEAKAAVEAGVGKVVLIDRKGNLDKGMHADGYEVTDDYHRAVDDIVSEDRSAEEAEEAEASE